MTTPGYALSVTAHRPGHRPDRARRVPRRRRRARHPRLHADRQRDGLHHPVLRRPRRPQRPRDTNCAASACTQKNGQPEPPPDPGQSRTVPADPEEMARRPAPQPATLAELQALLDTFTGYYNHQPAAPRPCPTGPPPPPPTPPGPKPPPATAPPTPTTASAPTASTPTASSPSATPASSTTSASAEPTPEPTSCCSSRTCTSASSTPPPANSSATSPSTPPATTSPPDAPKGPPPGTPRRQKPRTLTWVRGHSDVLRDHTEPPYGIEPMTYALREAREYAAHALPAQTTRRTTLEALIAREFRGHSFHDPFHAMSAGRLLQPWASSGRLPGRVVPSSGAGSE